jgi:hypothetical protein
MQKLNTFAKSSCNQQNIQNNETAMSVMYKTNILLTNDTHPLLKE